MRAPLLYRIVVCLERETTEILSFNSPRLYCKTGFTNVFFYMAAIIHMVRPTRVEYVSLGLNVVYFPENQLTSTVERVNAIWGIHVTSANFGDLGPVTSAHFFSSRPSLLTLYSSVTLICSTHKKIKQMLTSAHFGDLGPVTPAHFYTS